MKKILLASVLAVASVSAFAAPAKSSKPQALTETQMAQVKGQGTVEVWVWDDCGYVLSQRSDTGPYGISREIYIGGPLDTYAH